MAPISARTAALAKWAVIPAALIAGGIVVSQASYSAFSSETTDGVTNWKAGTVALTSTTPGTATFQAANLAPGDTGYKCITVTSTGSLPSDVRLYVKNLNTESAKVQPRPYDLSPKIELDIKVGDPGSTCDSAPLPESAKTIYGVTATDSAVKTLAGLSAKNDYANGIPTTWTIEEGETVQKRAFQIKYTLNDLTSNEAQGGITDVVFTWEAQSKNS